MTLFANHKHHCPTTHNLLMIAWLTNVISLPTTILFGVLYFRSNPTHRKSHRPNRKKRQMRKTQHTKTHEPPAFTTVPRIRQRPDPPTSSQWIRDLTEDGDVEPHPGPPNQETGQTIRTMTLNISRDPLNKLPAIISDLQINQIDIAFLTETDAGTNFTNLLKDTGYKHYSTEGKHAGATILIKEAWTHKIIGAVQTIQKGRAIALKLSTPAGQILLASLYQYSGLEKETYTSPKFLRAQANIDRVIDLITPDTCLAICGGDFNDTSDESERFRATPTDPDNIKKRKHEASFAPLLDAHFVDTHEYGEMTCTTNTPKGPSSSRIDRIFIWARHHTKITATRVEKLPKPITTNHSAIYTTIQTASMPTELPPEQPQATRIQTKHVTKQAKQAYAEDVNKKLKHKAPGLIRRIQNWKANLPDSDQAIADFKTTVKKIALKHFGTTYRKQSNTQEHKTRIRIRNLAKVLRRIETLQEQSRENFQRPKTQKRFETLIARLPRYLQTLKAPLKSPRGKLWVAQIRNEKLSKLTKLHTDRQTKARKKKTRQNPQDEALTAKRSDTHENISAVPEENNGNITLTTNPDKVKKAVAAYFKNHLGRRGPKMRHPPPWLQKELCQKKYTGTYSLDNPFTQQELSNSLAQTKNSAAPGKDGIPIAAFKFAIQNAPEGQGHTADILLAITQAIYDAEGRHKITKEIVCKPLYKKPGIKDLTNLRPIALQNSLAKIPSKLLAARLAINLFDNGAIHSANEGFLKGRNTGNALTTILNVWEDAKAFQKPCYCISYDVSKAYDHLRWFTIKHGMQRLNLPPKFQNYVLGKMKGSTIEFKTRYGNTDPFEVKRGTAQGCPLSPLIYIISMDLLHAGLHKNPEDGEEYGYKMEKSSKTIADKCYADDTLLLASTVDGLTRMNKWVNTFCGYNYISMNHDKTKIFGLDENRQDMTLSLPVVQHTNTGTTISMVHSQTASKHIKHLGLWMNMHLDWTRAINDVSSKIGWHSQIISANSLSTEAATYLINAVLTPKIEYRLRFFLAPKDKIATWDAQIHKTVNNTFNHRTLANRDAVTTLAHLTLPSEIQNLAAITHLQRTAAEPEHSDAGWTTRLRLRHTKCVLDPTDAQVNWSKQTRIKAGNTFHLELIDAPPFLPPQHWEGNMAYPYAARTLETKIQGKTMALPTDFFGTWGASTPQVEVAVYTDGSKKATDNQESTGSWAAILHDDSYEEHWARLHEKQGRLPREDLIKKLKIPVWGGQIPNPRSSYSTELEAITRMSMILPSSWKVTIWTDSKSSIDRIEALRRKDSIKTMCEPEWELLNLFMSIEALRKEPIILRHVRSHTKQMEIKSVGNAAADLRADQARLFADHTPLPEHQPLPPMIFRQYNSDPIVTYKALRKYIGDKMKTNVKKTWGRSKTQAVFIKNSHEPERMIKLATKGSTCKHTGTLIDVLTGTITKPSYVKPEPIHCLYCKHVRNSHQIRPLTPEHLAKCVLNTYGKRTLVHKLQKEITSNWEPEWEHREETPDTTLKIAHRLVNQLQTKTKNKKLWINTERGWLGQIWPSDLDRLAIHFVEHRLKHNLTIDETTWTQAITEYVRGTDCGCKSQYKCHETCKHSMDLSPPVDLQSLASSLVQATTIRYANILQKTPKLKHVVNTHGADRLWGSKHPDECPKDNYFYSPPVNFQLKALRLSAELKRSDTIQKTFGVVLLDADTQAEIDQGHLALIATIPARCMHLSFPPSTRKPKKKGTTHLSIGLILGISKKAKTRENADILIAIHTLRHWQRKFCPAAVLHEETLVTELSNQSMDNFSLTDDDWHKHILHAWRWIASPTGSQGIILKEDQQEVTKLKGSTKYNDTTHKIALDLFTFFAEDWENKNNLLPMQARRWWYRYSEDTTIVSPIKETRDKKKRKEIQQTLASEAQNIALLHKRQRTQINPDDTRPIDKPDKDPREKQAILKDRRRELARQAKCRNRIAQHALAPPTQSWTCPCCTFTHNNTEENVCGICFTKRPKTYKTGPQVTWSTLAAKRPNVPITLTSTSAKTGTPSTASAPRNPKKQSWSCTECNSRNSTDFIRCGHCGTLPTQAVKWNCTSCSFNQNSIREKKCAKCTEPQPAREQIASTSGKRRKPTPTPRTPPSQPRKAPKPAPDPAPTSTQNNKRRAPASAPHTASNTSQKKTKPAPPQNSSSTTPSPPPLSPVPALSSPSSPLPVPPPSTPKIRTSKRIAIRKARKDPPKKHKAQKHTPPKQPPPKNIPPEPPPKI
jgi:hypothetical protein